MAVAMWFIAIGIIGLVYKDSDGMNEEAGTAMFLTLGWAIMFDLMFLIKL